MKFNEAGDKLYHQMLDDLKAHPIIGKDDDHYEYRKKYADKVLQEKVGMDYKNIPGLKAFGHALYDAMLKEEEMRHPISRDTPIERIRYMPEGPALPEKLARDKFNKWAEGLAKNIHRFEHLQGKEFEWFEPIAVKVYANSDPGIDADKVIENFHELNWKKDAEFYKNKHITGVAKAITENMMHDYGLNEIRHMRTILPSVFEGLYRQIKAMNPTPHIFASGEEPPTNPEKRKRMVSQRRENAWLSQTKMVFRQQFLDKLKDNNGDPTLAMNILNRTFHQNGPARSEEEVVRYLDSAIDMKKPDFVHRMVKEHGHSYRPKR